MHMDLQTSAWERWKLEPFMYVILWILVQIALLLILWILNQNIVLRRFCTRRNYFSLLLFLLKHNLKYVPSLTFKTCRFMHWGESQGAVDISLLYLCQFLPIFVLIICRHFCWPMSPFQGHVTCQIYPLWHKKFNNQDNNFVSALLFLYILL